jgi:hypothetical protein
VWVHSKELKILYGNALLANSRICRFHIGYADFISLDALKFGQCAERASGAPWSILWMYSMMHQSCLILLVYKVTFFSPKHRKKLPNSSTEQTVIISLQFFDFWSSVIQVYGMNLQFSGSIRKNFGNGNGSFWKKNTFFLSFWAAWGLN